jgi:hypothetical protein
MHQQQMNSGGDADPEKVGGSNWWRYHLVAIDPGVTTGVAIFHFPPRTVQGARPPAVQTHQVHTAENIPIAGLASTIFLPKRPHAIVIEQYVTRPSGHGSVGSRHHTELSPIWVAGQLLGWLEAQQGKKPAIYWQQAGLAMGAFPPKRLKDLFPSLYRQTRGQPHARDALIHGLRWLKAERNDLFMRVPRD